MQCWFVFEIKLINYKNPIKIFKSYSVIFLQWLTANKMFSLIFMLVKDYNNCRCLILLLCYAVSLPNFATDFPFCNIEAKSWTDSHINGAKDVLKVCIRKTFKIISEYHWNSYEHFDLIIERHDILGKHCVIDCSRLVLKW